MTTGPSGPSRNPPPSGFHPAGDPDENPRDDGDKQPSAGAFPGAVARVEHVAAVDDMSTHILQEEETHSTAGRVTALCVMAAIGIAAAAAAPRYGMTVGGERIGPGFLPLVAGGGLAILALVLIAGELRRAVAARRQPSAGAAEPVPPDSEITKDDLGRTMAQRQRNMRIVTVALVVTIALIPMIGFIESFALLLLFVSIFVERRPVLPALIITLGAVVTVYLIFVAFLNVRLPMGALAYLNLGG